MLSGTVRKSPTDKILEDTIKKVEEDKDFTKEVVEALKGLKVKDFTKSSKILKVLKMEVSEDETS